MSLPRKGTRRLEVDGDPYRWHVRKHPTYVQGALQASMVLAVEREGGRGVLVVDLVVSRPDNWVAPHQTSVTPALVREMVRAAHAAGWDPAVPGRFDLTFPLVRH